MLIFISMVMAAAAIGFILYPLLKQRTIKAERMENSTVLELSSKRDTTYAMLKEVEFDYQAGILVEDDYRALEDHYKRKAVSLVREIHDIKEADDNVEKEIQEFRSAGEEPPDLNPEDAIEMEVLKLRSKRSCPDLPKNSDLNEAIEEEIRSLRKPAVAGAAFCTKCGVKAGAGDLFCANCGTKLKHLEEAR